MKAEDSEARNKAAFATSSAIPILSERMEFQRFLFIRRATRKPFGEQRRFDVTGTDGIDADAIPAMIDGHRPSHPNDARLRGVVRRAARPRTRSCPWLSLSL